MARSILTRYGEKDSNRNKIKNDKNIMYNETTTFIISKAITSFIMRFEYFFNGTCRIAPNQQQLFCSLHENKLGCPN
jgi:hypothetical protein